jgi:hypothetical protein
MIWLLKWGPVAIEDVRHIAPEPARRICAAVMRFAETEEGPVSRVHPHDERRLKLIVPGAIAYLTADEQTGILHVERLFARAR